MGLDVGIEQVQVASASAFAGKTLAEVQIRRDMGVIILAIRKADGQMFFNPPADATITSGDHLIAMGEPQGLRRLEQLLTGASA
jgi:voltage-gated potassium channel